METSPINTPVSTEALDSWNTPRSSEQLRQFVSERLKRNLGARAINPEFL